MKETKELKATSVAFTGHRTIPQSQIEKLRGRLKSAVISSYEDGARTFYCGMALGFDMLAAEVILSLREQLPHIQLFAVVPFQGQSRRWSFFDKMRHGNILSNADNVITLSDHYYNGCLHARNAFMLKQSSGVIAYFNGKPEGGTYFTCKSAAKQGMKIVNLFSAEE